MGLSDSEQFEILNKIYGKGDLMNTADAKLLIEAAKHARYYALSFTFL